MIDAASNAAEAVRAQHLDNPDGAGDAAAAAADVLGAAGRLLEGPAGGPLTDAARDYDRAARERYGRTPEPSQVGSLLRVAALQLARASQQGGGGQDAARAALFITQIARLAAAVSRLREAQERAGQAAAARRTATGLGNAASTWDSAARDSRATATLTPATTRRPTSVAPTTTRQGPRT